MSRFRVAGLLLVTAAGCSHGEDVARLQTEISSLQTANADLVSRVQSMEDSQKELADVPDKVSGLQTAFENTRTEWRNFKAAYDENTAMRVTENLKVISEAIQKLQDLQVAADSRLKEMDASRAKAAELLELMSKHETQAKDINQIGELQTALQALKQKLDSMQSGLTQTQADVRQAKSTADDAGRKATLAEQKATEAQFKANSAIRR